MNDYKKITIWGNHKRVKLLNEFKGLIITYFNNIEQLDWSLNVRENEKAKQMRTEINKNLNKIHSFIVLAGVNPEINYFPPPAVGGVALDIDVVNDIFNLHHFLIDPQQLLDFIDRAIGIYENDRLNSLLRTINPLFWIGLILDYIVSLPFKIIGGIGFDQKKIESSNIGKIVKGILYLIVVFASFLTVLEKLGYLEKLRLLIQG